MKYNKILYIRYLPLTEKVFNDFFLADTIKAGFEVEYWDITKVCLKLELEQEDDSYLATCRKFLNYKEIAKAIKLQNIERTLFVVLMPFEQSVTKLYRIFAKNNCCVAAFGRNQLPQPPVVFSKRYNVFDPKRLKRILKRIHFEFLKKVGALKANDIIFYDGELGWCGVGIISEKEFNEATQVRINSVDYDTILALEKTGSQPVVQGDYVLFLDEYLPLHPDFKILTGYGVLDVATYYNQLNRYFDRIEKQYGIPVVIAAHPKALRYKKENFFNGRQVYWKKTVELSLGAKFFITHDSTSLNFAVILGKPLHFITSDAIKEALYTVHADVLLFSELLGCRYQYVDRDDEPLNISMEVCTERYEWYKKKYMTSDQTKQILSRDIFLDFLKRS